MDGTLDHIHVIHRNGSIAGWFGSPATIFKVLDTAQPMRRSAVIAVSKTVCFSQYFVRYSHIAVNVRPIRMQRTIQFKVFGIVGRCRDIGRCFNVHDGLRRALMMVSVRDTLLLFESVLHVPSLETTRARQREDQGRRHERSWVN